MRILVVEDDSLQAESIIENLKRIFPRDKVDLIQTEYDFQSQLGDIQQNVPGIIVMDVMLPWCEPSEQMPPAPDEVVRDGFFRAGFRCQKLLADNEKTRDIPIIFFTVLEKGDLKPQLRDQPEEITFLQKDDNINPLIALIREKAKR